MPQPNANAVQVRVDALPACYQALVEALTLAEFSAAEMQDIFARYVLAECLQCGVQFTGEDLGRIALTSPGDPSEDPRFTRLRQGYCARGDCDAYYYRLILNEHPKVDWQKLAAGLSQTAAPPPPALAPPRPATGLGFWLADQRTRRVLAGVAILLLLLLIRHFVTGGSLAFLHKTPKYTVDPASVTDAPR